MNSQANHLKEWLFILCVVKVTTHCHYRRYNAVNLLALAVLLLRDLDVVGFVAGKVNASHLPAQDVMAAVDDLAFA
jgi:hypothetical protein